MVVFTWKSTDKVNANDRNYRKYTPVISYSVATNTATFLFKNFGE